MKKPDFIPLFFDAKPRLLQDQFNDSYWMQNRCLQSLSFTVISKSIILHGLHEYFCFCALISGLVSATYLDVRRMCDVWDSCSHVCEASVPEDQVHPADTICGGRYRTKVGVYRQANENC